MDWKNPDYSEVYRERTERLLRLRGDAGALAGVWEYYRERPREFVNDWGVTVDPRNAELGRDVSVPFVLFPKQGEYLDWLYARWRGREKGLVYKSRDMGVSWLCVAFGVWMWIFHPGVVVGYGSRKEEYVDELGDPKSLFWKVRSFIENLPPEFRPAEWSSAKMKILNLDNGSAIVGEAGDSIGRGNRTSIYFVDESAHLENQGTVDAALSATTNCRIDVSTPVSVGGLFERKVAAGKLPVFTFPWQDDPRKGEEWYRKQVEELDPVVLAQEVDLNPMASIENVLLDGGKVSEAFAAVIPAQGAGPWMIGVDAAHMGNDSCVIHSRRGRLNLPQIVIKGETTGDQLAAAVEQHCDTLTTAGGEIGQIVIELDGPGASCFDFLRLGRYKDYVRGIHTGAKQKDNRHYNLRAKLWLTMKTYFEEGGVTLPMNMDLKQQLCSMLYSFKDGMYLIMSKQEYKKLFKRSPDNADAMVLTFYPYRPNITINGSDPFRARSNARTGWMAF